MEASMGLKRGVLLARRFDDYPKNHKPHFARMQEVIDTYVSLFTDTQTVKKLPLRKNKVYPKKKKVKQEAEDDIGFVFGTVSSTDWKKRAIDANESKKTAKRQRVNVQRQRRGQSGAVQQPSVKLEIDDAAGVQVPRDTPPQSPGFLRCLAEVAADSADPLLLHLHRPEDYDDLDSIPSLEDLENDRTSARDELPELEPDQEEEFLDHLFGPKHPTASTFG